MSLTHQAYQQLFSDKLRQALQRLKPKAVTPSLSILVQAGLHSGFSTQFHATELTIGGSESSDLVLLDDGIVDEHVKLSFDWSVVGAVVGIQCNQPNVFVNGVLLTDASQPVHRQLPLTLKIGDVELYLESTQRSTRSKKLTLLDHFTIPLTCLLILILFIQWGNPITGSSGFKQFSIQTPTLNTEVTSEGSADTNALIETLYERLEAEGLDTHISIRQPSPTLVIAEGILPESKMSAWEGVQYWFDGEGTSLILISSVSAAPVLSDFPAIAMVRFTAPAEVRFISGRRARIGDVVVNDWAISDITSDGIEMSRDGDTLTINF